MHPRFVRAEEISAAVIGAAIEVHRALGPGLLESIYERCLKHELSLRNLEAATQKVVRITYKGLDFEEILRCDILVEDCLLVEVKAVERVLPIHKAQLLSYMKLLNVPLGLLFNFHQPTLKDGVARLVLTGASGSVPSRPSRSSVQPGLA